MIQQTLLHHSLRINCIYSNDINISYYEEIHKKIP